MYSLFSKIKMPTNLEKSVTFLAHIRAFLAASYIKINAPSRKSLEIQVSSIAK